MPRRLSLERKFRIDPILNARWREMIPPRLGDTLIRAMMNKLVEEVGVGEEVLLHHVMLGNFSLLRGAKMRRRVPDRIIDRSPRDGRFLHKSEEDIPYHRAWRDDR